MLLHLDVDEPSKRNSIAHAGCCDSVNRIFGKTTFDGISCVLGLVCHRENTSVRWFVLHAEKKNTQGRRKNARAITATRGNTDVL